MKKIGICLLMIFIASVTVAAQSPPTLRIETETPGLPSELFYGSVKVKPVRLRPGTNQVITIDDVDFLVQQQYIDFLLRFPDPTGFANWVTQITNCPNQGFGIDHPECDRVRMSAGFFQSNEFQGRGYWLMRYGFVGLNRSITDNSTGTPRTQRSALTYAEFIPGLQQIGGSNSPAQEEAAKVVYADAFVLRSDFQALFPTSMTPSQYVNGLESNAGVSLPNKQQLIDALTAGSMTRAQVLRNVIESQVVFDKFLTPSFVALQYVGYLRRNPDPIGYNNWIETLNANPGDYRHMVFGFLYSTEYRNRF